MDQGFADGLRPRGALRRFVLGLPRRGLVIAAVLMLAAVGVFFAGYAKALGPVIRGRVVAEGKPLAGATCYLMPDCYEYAPTDRDGRFEIGLAPFDHAREVDVSVVAPDRRRTEFGEHIVRPGLFGVTEVLVDLTGRKPW